MNGGLDTTRSNRSPADRLQQRARAAAPSAAVQGRRGGGQPQRPRAEVGGGRPRRRAGTGAAPAPRSRCRRPARAPTGPRSVAWASVSAAEPMPSTCSRASGPGRTSAPRSDTTHQSGPPAPRSTAAGPARPRTAPAPGRSTSPAAAACVQRQRRERPAGRGLGHRQAEQEQPDQRRRPGRRPARGQRGPPRRVPALGAARPTEPNRSRIAVDRVAGQRGRSRSTVPQRPAGASRGRRPRNRAPGHRAQRRRTAGHPGYARPFAGRRGGTMDVCAADAPPTADPHHRGTGQRRRRVRPAPQALRDHDDAAGAVRHRRGLHLHAVGWLAPAFVVGGWCCRGPRC